MTGVEYRLTWRREGMRKKSVRFASLSAAERRLGRLRVFEAGPHVGCDHDDPFSGYCFWPDGFKPIVEGPTIEERPVGPWGRVE